MEPVFDSRLVVLHFSKLVALALGAALDSRVSGGGQALDSKVVTLPRGAALESWVR